MDNNASSTDYSPLCYFFEIVADTDEDAEIYIEADILNDGKNVFSKKINSTNWHKSQFLFAAPYTASPIKFAVKKEGDGHGKLYMVKVEGIFECYENSIRVTP